MRFSEAALAWLSFPLEHLKISQKCSSGNSGTQGHVSRLDADPCLIGENRFRICLISLRYD
jgi:hypothetical protein